MEVSLAVLEEIYWDLSLLNLDEGGWGKLGPSVLAIILLPNEPSLRIVGTFLMMIGSFLGGVEWDWNLPCDD